MTKTISAFILALAFAVGAFAQVPATTVYCHHGAYPCNDTRYISPLRDYEFITGYAVQEVGDAPYYQEASELPPPITEREVLKLIADFETQALRLVAKCGQKCPEDPFTALAAVKDRAQRAFDAVGQKEFAMAPEPSQASAHETLLHGSVQHISGSLAHPWTSIRKEN